MAAPGGRVSPLSLPGAGSETCVTCNYEFKFDATFFASRNLAPPRRCRRCRELRRASRARFHGRLTSAGVRFVVVRADDGSEFIAPPLLPREIALGARVVFIGQRPEPGCARGLADDVSLEGEEA